TKKQRTKGNGRRQQIAASILIMALENEDGCVGRPKLTAELSYGVQALPADLHWLGIDKRKSDHTRRSAAVDPIVDRAALHEDVARFQMNDRVVKLHVDLTRHDDGVID